MRTEYEQLVAYGSRIVSAVVATGVGFLAAGPPGVIAASALGPMLQGLSEDWLHRQMSERELERAGAGLSWASMIIKERLGRGEIPRSDGFFEGTTNRPPDAEILLEGVLLKCKSEYEQHKLLHIGALFANVAFDHCIDPSTANFFLSVVSSLTYQQICLLALVDRSEEMGFDTLRLDRPKGDLTRQTAIRCQVEGLQGVGVHLLSSDETRFQRDAGVTVVRKTAYFLSDMGKQFSVLSCLDLVPRARLVETAQQFESA